MANLSPFVVAFLLVSFPTAAMYGAMQVETVDRMTENVPDVPADLLERSRRYQGVRAAAPHGWVADGTRLFVTTTFGNSAQVHWVKTPAVSASSLRSMMSPSPMSLAILRATGLCSARMLAAPKRFSFTGSIQKRVRSSC
jgi:hypothetical protein